MATQLGKAASPGHLSGESRRRYIDIMKTPTGRSLQPAAIIALSALVLAAATGVAFSAWMEKGAAIFMTYAQAGLAWCF
ncbi:hypothetical protein [Mesorhizobium sp. Z1-4]|uniref:hypothetical protein n=1 Tax=Mesorhizobium sp. Z1-4 TaxID=2448478 RepID=UPI000FD8C107|nr:hypothetical protein [Mesorhizobium sp. Z1-4]